MTSLIDPVSGVSPAPSAEPDLHPPDWVPEPPPGRSSAHRLNGLDGFRAIAVAVVVLFHFGVPGFSGGWLGPELFFVLSGYLITTLLLDRSEPGGPRLSIRDFWTRRVKRLYPALLFVVVALIAVVSLLAALRVAAVAPLTPASIRSDSLASLAYYANWHLIGAHVGYFGASTSLFKHTWSLAIEEQFYLVWPLVFVLIRRSRNHWRAWGIALAGTGAVLSAIDNGAGLSQSTLNSHYYATQTNAFHLLVGVALAFACHGWDPGVGLRRWLGRMSLPALAIIALFVATASGRDGIPRLWMLRSGEPIVDLAAATLLLSLVFGHRHTLVSRALNLRPVVWIGSVSYGLYLWHYPLAVLVTTDSTGLPHAAVVAIGLSATVAAAAFSYRFVEVVIRETMIVSARLRRTLLLGGLTGSIAMIGWAPWLIRG
jgi:peptidoglycan/LPS O-acetylase OafA/YrhL